MRSEIVVWPDADRTSPSSSFHTRFAFIKMNSCPFFFLEAKNGKFQFLTIHEIKSNITFNFIHFFFIIIIIIDNDNNTFWKIDEFILWNSIF